MRGCDDCRVRDTLSHFDVCIAACTARGFRSSALRMGTSLVSGPRVSCRSARTEKLTPPSLSVSLRGGRGSSPGIRRRLAAMVSASR